MEGDPVVCGEEEAGGSPAAGSEDDLSRCIPSTSTRTTTTTTPRITTTMVSTSTSCSASVLLAAHLIVSVTNDLIFQTITTTTRLPPAPALARALAPARARVSAPALGSQLAPARAPALGSLQARASNDGPHEGLKAATTTFTFKNLLRHHAKLNGC